MRRMVQALTLHSPAWGEWNNGPPPAAHAYAKDGRKTSGRENEWIRDAVSCLLHLLLVGRPALRLAAFRLPPPFRFSAPRAVSACASALPGARPPHPSTGA